MATLFDRLGGIEAVTAAVEEMYTRLLADPVTAPFFNGVGLLHLKYHQVKFMKIAFTQIPTDLDVPAFLRVSHRKLFATMGLNETHFDKVVEHFIGACRSLRVEEALIKEAAAVIGPLRSVFEQGAIEFANKA